MRLANRTKDLKPSATLAITARAKAMRAAGDDVLALSAGEPDFATPANIRSRATAAIEAGMSKYTPVPGMPELREAIAKRYSTTYGEEFTATQTIVGAGGKQVLFNAIATCVDPGDEVVFACPYWVSYPDMVRSAGGIPKPAKSNSPDSVLPRAAELNAAINDKTKLVILNSPSNPTGSAYSRSEITEIADMLCKHEHVAIISDDIYEALVFDEPFSSVGHFFKGDDAHSGLRDRTLLCTGVSKTYAMTGWRVGYGIGPEPWIKAMSSLQGCSTSGASCIAQAAAVEALLGDQSAVEEMVVAFKQRRDLLVEGLKAIDGIEITPPAGTFYAFPRVSALYGDKIDGSIAFCEQLLVREKVAAVPGAAFGADDFIRLSFACSETDLNEALVRLRRFISSLGNT